LGQLLEPRLDELQLAPPPGASGDPRLRGGARGGPPRGPGPLAPLLVAAPAPLPGVPAPRALAQTLRVDAAAVDGPPSNYSQRQYRTASAVPPTAHAASAARAPRWWLNPEPVTIAAR